MLLLRWERHLEEKEGDGLFKPSLLKIEGLTSGFSVRFMQMAIFAGFLFTYPLLLQLSFEYTAIETGLALMPFSIALLIAAMVGARLTAKYQRQAHDPDRFRDCHRRAAVPSGSLFSRTSQPPSWPAAPSMGSGWA